ncbi:gas vesicle protein K [Kitasatospora sp. NPDC127111]|uniref:gas vesicle protein K n=1 Tax=Kitasatospora sp. NPDC127111 TaxID=3345363 RepID=UPI00363B8C8C
MNGPPHDRTPGAPRPDPTAGRRVPLDPETVGRDLASLVLAVVELIRQLMERQALRRIDQGDLSEEQIERIGLTLMALDDRMTELRDRFGVTLDDLNLDLGPLGRLLSSD